jgi:hypothetical protein
MHSRSPSKTLLYKAAYDFAITRARNLEWVSDSGWNARDMGPRCCEAASSLSLTIREALPSPPTQISLLNIPSRSLRYHFTYRLLSIHPQSPLGLTNIYCVSYSSLDAKYLGLSHYYVPPGSVSEAIERIVIDSRC